MTRVLITGVDGFLGRKLFTYLEESYETFGISRKKEGKNIFLADLKDKKRIDDIIQEVKPDVLVHTAALVDVEKSEQDNSLAYLMNVTCTEYVASLCKERGIKMIYLSTDYVFSGKKSSYMPYSPKDPLNYYGETKSLGEERVKGLVSNFAIVRPTFLYGFNALNDKKNMVLNIIEKLKKKEKIEIDNKRIKYPLLIDDVARAIKTIIDKDSRGIFHLSGAESVTKYEFAKKIADIFGLSGEGIEGKDMKEPYRPDEVKLDVVEPIVTVLNLQKGLILVKNQIESYEDSTKSRNT